MAFTTVTVTATFLEPDNVTPATGHVTFQLTGDITDGAGGRILAKRKVRAVLDGSGAISVSLAATDDETTSPGGVVYFVTESIVGTTDNCYFIEIPSASPTLNLAEVAHVELPTPYNTMLETALAHIDDAVSDVAIASIPPGTYVAIRDITAAPYNADPEGVVDSGAGINQAYEDAGPNGMVRWPEGTFLSTGPIDITCSTWAEDGAELLVDGPGVVGLRIGSPAVSCDRKTLRLPKVNQTDRQWDTTGVVGTDKGIQVRAMDACDVWIPMVQNFSVGLAMNAEDQGISYNHIVLGALRDNAVQIDLAPTATGWCNQNAYKSGRVYYTDSTVAVPNTRACRVASATFSVDNNTFDNTSFEGDLPEYHVECYGNDNTWNQCRWEVNTIPGAKVHWAQTDPTHYAQRNIINGGYHSSLIVVTEGANTVANSVLHPEVDRRSYSSTVGQVLVNEKGDDFPILLGLKAADGPFSSTAAVDYQISVTAAYTRWKAKADAQPRIRVAHASGEIQFGTGAADPATLSTLRYTSPNLEVVTADLYIATAGKGLKVNGATVKLTGSGGTFAMQDTLDGGEVLASIENAFSGASSTDEKAGLQIMHGGGGAAIFGAGKEADFIGGSNRSGFIYLSTRRQGSYLERMRITSTGNVGLNTTDQFGGGVKVLGLADATTVPTTNPTAGVVAYSQGGVFKVRSSAGDIVSLAKQAAQADTSGATLGALETEVNGLKAKLRTVGLLAA